ncbi:MAG TPA: hypothetical protein VIA02_08765 [Candidatus Limnocylindria bacterium]|jgi:hypothetical protein
MTKKRGRPYQPLPKRQNRTYAIVILVVAVVLIVGIVFISTGR